MPCLKNNLGSPVPASTAGGTQVVGKRVGVRTFAKFLTAVSFCTTPGKLVLSIAICAMCYSCYPVKDLQGELVYATLVKVEEVSRFPNFKTKMLTWETDKSVSFITYGSSSDDMRVGTKTRVVVLR